MFFIFCLVFKTDEDLLILFLKEQHLSLFLFCDDTNVNTALPPKSLSHMINRLGIQNWKKVTVEKNNYKL